MSTKNAGYMASQIEATQHKQHNHGYDTLHSMIDGARITFVYDENFSPESEVWSE